MTSRLLSVERHFTPLVTKDSIASDSRPTESVMDQAPAFIAMVSSATTLP